MLKLSRSAVWSVDCLNQDANTRNRSNHKMSKSKSSQIVQRCQKQCTFGHCFWNVKPINVKVPKTLGVAGKLEVGNIKQPNKKAKEE